MAQLGRVGLADRATVPATALSHGERQLVEALGAAVTVLIIEHDLATRVTVLHLGRVLADGTPDEVRADEAVRRAYPGDAAPGELFLEGSG